MSDIAEFKAPLSAQQIQELLPHRFPFLLIDRVLEMEPGKTITAIKTVTSNEPWVPGHFPGRAVMPGVLMIEAMAQAGAIMMLVMPKFRGKLALLAGVNSARFKRVVEPGDVLTIQTKLLSMKLGMGHAEGTAMVGDELAARGELQFAFVGK